MIDDPSFQKVFGAEACLKAYSLNEAAKLSPQYFLRSTGQLYLYQGVSRGRKLSAYEAFERFGINPLLETLTEGSSVIYGGRGEPGTTLKKRRIDLDISIDELAAYIHESPETLQNIEDGEGDPNLRLAERIAIQLGIDERFIAVEIGARGDAGFAAGLKQHKKDAETGEAIRAKLDGESLLSLSEAAWIVKTQMRLSNLLSKDKGMERPSFATPLTSFYGDKDYPAHEVAYDLAKHTRKQLNIAPHEPILSMRDLCENTIQFPLIFTNLEKKIGGATIASNGLLGVVVNKAGENSNCLVQRMTIAHELCHYLYDNSTILEKIIIDSYNDIEPSSNKNILEIERRARAFAAEFLAPREAVKDVFESQNTQEEGIRRVMDVFSISLSAAKHQIQFSFPEPQRFSFSRLGSISTQPTQDQIAAEIWWASYFLNDSGWPPCSRLGKFCELVIQAQNNNYISDETARIYLACDEDVYKRVKAQIVPAIGLSGL